MKSESIWMPGLPWVTDRLGVSMRLFLKGQASGQFPVRILLVGDRQLVMVHREDAAALEAQFNQPISRRGDVRSITC